MGYSTTYSLRACTFPCSSNTARKGSWLNKIQYRIQWNTIQQTTAGYCSCSLKACTPMQDNTEVNSIQWDTVQQVTGYCSCPVKVCTSPCSSNTARLDTVQYDTMGYNTPQQVTAAAFSELAYFHDCPQHWTGEQHSSTKTEK